MSDNYYQEMLNEISRLIETESYDQAQGIVREELSMPYVPQTVQKQLQEFARELKTLTRSEKRPSVISRDQLQVSLAGGGEKAVDAINQLADVNIRNYLDIIEDYLLSNNSDH